MRTFRLLFFLSLIIISFIACDKKPIADKAQPLSAKQPAYGDILVRGEIGDASNLIPLLASDSASHNIAGMVFNGLVSTTRT